MVKYKKILFLLYSARTIIQLANAYIFIFFPSMLITNLQSGSYFAAAMVVLGFVGLQMEMCIRDRHGTDRDLAAHFTVTRAVGITL